MSTLKDVPLETDDRREWGGAQKEMKAEVEHPSIYKRLLAVMGEVAYVQKEAKEVNGQYRFVSHDAVTAKVRPAFIKHGVLVVTDLVGHRQDGNRTEVDMSVSFINADHPDDRITIQAFGYGIDTQDKGPGKAISYAVKYALLKALMLETGDDPERDMVEHEPAKITEDQIKDILALADEVKADIPKMLKFFKAPAIEKILAKDHERVVKMLESKRAQAN